MSIHPTAIIDKQAELDSSVEIGPYCVIEAGVRIGSGTRVYSHAYIASGTTIGERCQIHPFTTVGNLPQDMKFGGAPSYTRIGNDTIVREHTSINRGTMPESVTIVGNNCFLMGATHVGHNSELHDGVTLITGVMLAGHVTVQERAIIGGNSGVHQFVRIGELSMIAGEIAVRMDIPPFMSAGPTGITGPNSIGLRRAGLTSQERNEIRACFRTLYRSGLVFSHAIARVAETIQTDAGRRLLAFLQGASKRGIEGPAQRRRQSSDETDSD